ncbi:complex I NDUFA9 subunit family protein [Limisalsivibrio acetivorans]|uniref:complex I NDUFA9 subunit family protein n=1 Tax=Limisalsivibrio acetivorans TaxID=1304888 RepID=UPI0003B47BF0|nr:complex I NDUFA9 subunit family protein [Limisalsivibrio acetivorans]
MKVFLTGSTGFVGSRVMQELLDQGYEVKALVRDKEVPEGVEAVRGDILEPESFEGALGDVDAVIHLIGIIREFPAKGVTFEKLHYQASVNIIDAAERAGIKRFIHMSANGSRADAVSDYHKTKYKAEEHLRNSSLEWTIMRPSLIYGPGDSFINMLAGYMRKAPAFTYFGDGSYPMQPVSVHEVAEIFVNSIKTPETVGKLYPVCGNRVFTYKHLLKKIMHAIDRGMPLLPVPEFAVSFGITLFGGLSFFPITRDQFIMLTEGNTCEDREVFDTVDVTERNFDEEIKTYL